MRHRRTTSSMIAIAGLAAAAAGPASAQAAPAFTCEASALRGTVLGQPQAIEPVVFGRGQECKTGQATPTASLPALLEANVLLAAGKKVEDPLKPSATAVGGLAGARVELLPSLPIKLPIEQAQAAIDAIPVIKVPLTPATPLAPATEATVDVREAIRALLPNGMLPQTDLLSASVLSSVATATCDGGTTPKLAGASTIAGLKLLGQPIDVDTTLQQNVNVLDSASIDPSKVDISKLPIQVAGANVPLTPTLQAAIQPVLDGLPNIEIPAAVASVKLTANEQTRDATSLTQRALRAQISLVGQPLLDVVIGEAKVSATGECPKAAVPAPPPAPEPAELQCSDRKLVLLDVFQQGSKGIKLKGAANRDFVGKTVSIRFQADGNKVVAKATVGKDGGFSTFAKTPRASVRNTNSARYTAVRGSERSLPLKLTRRMRVSSVVNGKELVTIKGRITLPLAAPAQQIDLRRRIQCGKQEVIKRVKPDKDGRYEFRVPATTLPAVYRATTRVRKNTSNSKTYPTFTLPRGVDLLKR